MLGDVPFTDADGIPIFVGDIIEQTNFNGEQYLARYEVVIDPSDNEVCLLMISGNEKAMSLFNSYKYSAFGTVIASAF
jgi:flagellin-like hook-associated protein FlgL